MVSIVNCWTRKPDVYCGRGSALGNPFKMNGEKDRNKVCDKYEEYFNEEVREKQNQEMLEQLKHIYRLALSYGNVTIGCYCFPKRCHCDTIKAFVEEALNEKLNERETPNK